MADDEQAIVFDCTSLVVLCSYIHKSYLFRQISYINVYSKKLVNNLHIITLYKLHNKLSSVSSSSCRVCRAMLFDKLDTAKKHGLYTSNVSSRDVTSEVEYGLEHLQQVRMRCSP